MYYFHILVIIWSLAGHILIMFIMLSLLVPLYFLCCVIILSSRCHLLFFIVLSWICHYIVIMMYLFNCFLVLVIIWPIYCQLSLVCHQIFIILSSWCFLHCFHLLAIMFHYIVIFHYVVINLSVNCHFCHNFVIADYVY